MNQLKKILTLKLLIVFCGSILAPMACAFQTKKGFSASFSKARESREESSNLPINAETREAVEHAIGTNVVEKANEMQLDDEDIYVEESESNDYGEIYREEADYLQGEKDFQDEIQEGQSGISKEKNLDQEIYEDQGGYGDERDNESYSEDKEEVNNDDYV